MLVEQAEDPSSARLALAAAAHEVELYGSPVDRELLAKACEAPAVVMAFHQAMEDDAYAPWASDSLQNWEDTARAITAAGVPESLAAQRAAMVFGTTQMNRDFIKAASEIGTPESYLERAADAALIEECSQYVRDDIGKDDPNWDESKVKRDDIGRFADKDDTGVAFRVVGGRRVAISEQVQRQVSRQTKEPEVVERSNTDQEILYYAAQTAEARSKKEQQRRDRLQRARRAQTAQTSQKKHQAKRDEQARREKQTRAAAQERAGQRASTAKTKLLARTERQRADVKLRMQRAKKARAVALQPPEEGMNLGEHQRLGARDGRSITPDFGGTGGLALRPTGSTNLYITLDGATSFTDPGVDVVTDENSVAPAEITGFLFELAQMVEENVQNKYLAIDKSPETINQAGVYADAAFGAAMMAVNKKLLDETTIGGDDSHFYLEINDGLEGPPDILLVPWKTLRTRGTINVSELGTRMVIRTYPGDESTYVLRRQKRVSNPSTPFRMLADAEFGVSATEENWIVSKAVSVQWDESSVNRDDLGRFAEEEARQVAQANAAAAQARIARARRAQGARRAQAFRQAVQEQKAPVVQQQTSVQRDEQKQAQLQRSQSVLRMPQVRRQERKQPDRARAVQARKPPEPAAEAAPTKWVVHRLSAGAFPLTGLMTSNPNNEGGTRLFVINDDSVLETTGAEPGDESSSGAGVEEGRDYYSPASWSTLIAVSRAIKEGGGPQKIEVAGLGTPDDPYEVDHLGPTDQLVQGRIALVRKAAKRKELRRL